MERRQWLLRYLVERALAGAEKIGDAEIQSAAAEGPGAFSFGGVALPVEVRVIRERLETYYATDGANHGLRISIPARRYVPVFGKPGDVGPKRRTSLRTLSIALAALALIAVVAVASWRQRAGDVKSSRISAEATRSLREAIRSGPASFNSGFSETKSSSRPTTKTIVAAGTTFHGLNP